MAQIKLSEAYRVDILEYERGRGSKIDETLADKMGYRISKKPAGK